MVPQELIDWIAGEKEKGYTSEQLYDILMQYKNEETEVREALKIVFQPVTPDESVNLEKQLYTFSPFILVGMAMVVLIAGGVFFYSIYKEKNRANVQDNIQKELIKKLEEQKQGKIPAEVKMALNNTGSVVFEAESDALQCFGKEKGFELCLNFNKQKIISKIFINDISKEFFQIWFSKDFATLKDEEILKILCQEATIKHLDEQNIEDNNYGIHPLIEFSDKQSRDIEPLFQKFDIKQGIEAETSFVYIANNKEYSTSKESCEAQGYSIEALNPQPKVYKGNLTFDEYIALGYMPGAIIGNLTFDNVTSIPEGVKLPKIVKGNLTLNGLILVEHLILPEVIIGNLSLRGLTSAEHILFPREVGTIFLDKLTSAKNLILPEKVENVFITELKSAEHLVLPREIGGLLLTGLTSAENLILPDRVEYLYLEGLTSAEHLVLPDKILQLDLMRLTSAENLILPKEVKKLSLAGLTSAEHLILPEKIEALELSGLTSAEYLVLPPKVGRLSLDSLPEEEINKLKEIYNLETNLDESYRVEGKK